MKRREELEAFNNVSEAEVEMLEMLIEESEDYDLDKELPVSIKSNLLSIAMSTSLIVEDVVKEHNKIRYFLECLNDIDELKNDIMSIMVDLGITDIFDRDEENKLHVKDEYIEKYKNDISDDTH